MSSAARNIEFIVEAQPAYVRAKITGRVSPHEYGGEIVRGRLGKITIIPSTVIVVGSLPDPLVDAERYVDQAERVMQKYLDLGTPIRTVLCAD